MFGFGMWWLGRAEKSARAKGEGYGADVPEENAAEDLLVRERATTASTFDPPEAIHGRPSDVGPPIALAALPLVIVVAVNLLMSLFVLPRMDASFLEKPEWGETSLAAVGGVWAVVTALFVAIVVLVAVNYRRLPALRDSMDAGANASVLPVLSVASLVGFGSVVAALAGVFAGARLGARHRGRPAGVAGGRDQCAGLIDRLGLGRASRSRSTRWARPISRSRTSRASTPGFCIAWR